MGVEDLAVSDMLQRKHLAKGISEVSWSTFKDDVTYKSAWSGKQIVSLPEIIRVASFVQHVISTQSREESRLRALDMSVLHERA